MARAIAVAPLLPAAVGTGTWSRLVAPRRQRKLCKANAETTLESPPPSKCAVEFTYPVLAGCAVCGLMGFFWHV